MVDFGDERRSMTIRLPAVLHKRLHDVAYQRRATMNDIVIVAIQRELSSTFGSQHQGRRDDDH